MENKETMATSAIPEPLMTGIPVPLVTYSEVSADSLNVPTLTGSELMGRIYNVRNGRVARASSVSSKQLFDFSPNSGVVHIGSMGDYSVSKDLMVDTTLEQHMNSTQTEIFYSKDVNKAFSVEVGVSGEVGAFSGEMSDCYSQTNSSHYESSMSLARQYSQYAVYKIMMKGDKADWRKLLKPDVSKDINDSSISGPALIKKYGTHFLASGYFGGIWMYSQSISTYLASTSQEINHTISASAAAKGVAISGTWSETESITETNSSSTTELHLDAIGGNTSSDYAAWQASVNEGNWNLINFDNKTNVSLQPLSVLVDPAIANYQARVDEIDAAIKAELAPYALQTLRWKPERRQTIDSGNVEKRFVLDAETESNKVIVGLAFKVDDSKIKVMNAQVLDLDTGTTDWYTTDTTGKHVPVNQHNTETGTGCAPGYVLTGLGLNAGSKKMNQSILYGQAIDALNVDNNSFIANEVKTFGGGNPDDSYVPVHGNDLIITGVEVGARHGNLGTLYLHFGRFTRVAV